MSEEIMKSGFYFDEYYALRVLEPEIATETVDLTDECSGFAEKLKEFRTISKRFSAITDSIATKVEAAKMQAIGAQTLLKAKVNQRETAQKELQMELVERNMELERLKVELQALQRIEAHQQELLENLYQTM